MSQRKPIDLANVTLAVLAGGRGQRMGLPKVFLELEGTPVLAWLLRRLQWPGPTMLATAPAVAHPPGSELFDREVIDPVDGLGPLRGIMTALTQLPTPTAVFVTVDMPGVVPSALAWLAESLANHAELNGVMCRVVDGSIEHVEPFPSAFRATAAPHIAQRLASERLSVQGLCTDPHFRAVDAPRNWPADLWTNLNTQADLAGFTANRAVNKLEQAK